MSQDVNKIIDTISAEWAQDVATLRKRNAVLTEENGRLRAELAKQAEEKSQTDEIEDAE